MVVPHLQAFVDPLEPLEVPLDVPLEALLLVSLLLLLLLLPELDDSEELDGDDDRLLDWLELLRLELLELEPSGSRGSDAKPKLGGIETARVWQR